MLYHIVMFYVTTISGTTSVVYLVCTDDESDNGTLKFVRRDRASKTFVSKNLCTQY